MAVALFGLLLTLWLAARRSSGALLVGILASTVAAIAVNAATGGRAFPIPGQAVWPAALVAWPDFSSLGAGLDLSVVRAARRAGRSWSRSSRSCCRTSSTPWAPSIGIGGEAGWLTREGRLPRLDRVLLVDGLAAVAGGAAGASSATTYIESAAGVAAGARSGLASVVTGICFLLALFFAPLAGVVPAQATAPALIVVGYLMSRVVRDIPLNDLEEGFPALLTLAVMPFTYSITNGIGAGFIAYCFIKLVRGKGAQVPVMMYVAALAFAIYFALPLIQRLIGA